MLGETVVSFLGVFEHSRSLKLVPKKGFPTKHATR